MITIATIIEAGVPHLPPKMKNRIAMAQLRAKVIPMNNPIFLSFPFILYPSLTVLRYVNLIFLNHTKNANCQSYKDY